MLKNNRRDLKRNYALNIYSHTSELECLSSRDHEIYNFHRCLRYTQFLSTNPEVEEYKILKRNSSYALQSLLTRTNTSAPGLRVTNLAIIAYHYYLLMLLSNVPRSTNSEENFKRKNFIFTMLIYTVTP